MVLIVGEVLKRLEVQGASCKVVREKPAYW